MCPQEVTVASEGAGGWRRSGVRLHRWTVVTLLTLCAAALLPAPANGRVFLLHDKGLDRHGWRDDEAPHLYRMDLEENDVVVLGRYRTRYGEDRGRKRREGDHRTPEGKYEIDWIEPRGSWEMERFGPWSMHISYPNWYDRQRSSNPGSNILIHGGHDSVTYGCIRVLDGGYRTFGKENITFLATHTSRGTPILSADHVPRRLKGYPQDRLGSEAATLFRALLEREVNNDVALESIRDYGRGGGRPAATTASSRPSRSLSAPTSTAVTVRASSVYHHTTSRDYVAGKVLDGRRETAWCEGAFGVGEGEWIEIDLGRERAIDGFEIVNGYDTVDRWKRNNRVAKLEITTDTGHSYTATFADDRSLKRLSFPDRPIRAQTIRFTIESVYSGRIWGATCLSTLEIVYGYDGS